MDSKKSIKVQNVSKYFGRQQVLNGVDLECVEGKITGIVGRNGTGKTVLFKIICGLMEADEGEIWINGSKRKKAADVLSSAGIIIEEPAFLKNHTGIHNLEYLYRINNNRNRQYLENIMEKVGLDAKSKKHVGKYSMGMRQRLAIAQAIMENPDILILDEPFNGLDNQGVEEMRKLFLELKTQGKIILVASHNSEDIHVLCDDVYSMDLGTLTPAR